MAHTLDQARPLRNTFRFGLSDYLALARQRRALAQMDNAQLRDLGITVQDALTEASRPVWDVPAQWLR